MIHHDSQSIATWLVPECTRAQLACVTWQEATKAAIALLVDSGAAAESYTAAVIAREHMFPTGLPTEPYGVALPHATGVIRCSAISLVTLREPVIFGQMGDPDERVAVRLVIGLAIEPKNQVSTLEALIQLIQQPGFLESVANAPDDTALYQVWQSWTLGAARKD